MGSRRNALLGTVAWFMIKRRLRKGGGTMRLIGKLVKLTAGLAAIAGGAWWFLRRGGSSKDTTEA